MAAGGGAACAACKYQRRRCTADCQLAQYFPQDRPRLFRNAHRLFGVSNILKTLARVGPERRRDAMTTIIFEANAWEAYPAHGCVPLILELDHRIRQAQLQLNHVKQSIKAYRDALGDHTKQGGDQQLIICEEDDSLLLQAPWIHQGQYDMMSSNNGMAAASVIPQPPQHRHQDHDIQPLLQTSVQQPHEMSYYFVDSIDEEVPLPPRESSITDSSSEKKEPKMMEGGFTLAGAASNLN